MKYIVSLMAAAIALGSSSARSDDIESGISLASLNYVTASSIRTDGIDSHRNTALIKEEESESPEMIAMIESNREDRERMVVIDR
ncbi:hypothetical protein [Bradyrhizobium sp.]|uniref:hypothetical protein n=1 Tax=Bradyrhizobium sp. TaxID=376 RepID=UPI002DF858D3|nr:hypothetical protein [Bradyrhizobium sp.]